MKRRFFLVWCRIPWRNQPTKALTEGKIARLESIHQYRNEDVDDPVVDTLQEEIQKLDLNVNSHQHVQGSKSNVKPSQQAPKSNSRANPLPQAQERNSDATLPDEPIMNASNRNSPPKVEHKTQSDGVKNRSATQRYASLPMFGSDEAKKLISTDGDFESSVYEFGGTLRMLCARAQFFVSSRSQRSDKIGKGAPCVIPIVVIRVLCLDFSRSDIGIFAKTHRRKKV